MICSALSRIMPADMIIHGSRFVERNRVENDVVLSDWMEFARGKDEAINLAFERGLSNGLTGCFEMGWNTELRDYTTMLDWEYSLFFALQDRKNGKVS